MPEAGSFETIGSPRTPSLGFAEVWGIEPLSGLLRALDFPGECEIGTVGPSAWAFLFPRLFGCLGLDDSNADDPGPECAAVHARPFEFGSLYTH